MFKIPDLHRFTTSGLRRFEILDLHRFVTLGLRRFEIPDLHRFVLTVKIRQPSHEFTFGVGITFVSYSLVLTPVV
jgi:hypothetical protein